MINEKIKFCVLLGFCACIRDRVYVRYKTRESQGIGSNMQLLILVTNLGMMIATRTDRYKIYITG